ncbi:hypothetical protein CLOM_g24668 [Closterium sp. NIES-68]|nr:hypothetical protein CLOM_g24668 [Closterium sp. NIES-68]GJP70525.1 hypothetical protein CLOP_g1458 [Closterium sp. NIES-67]
MPLRNPLLAAPLVLLALLLAAEGARLRHVPRPRRMLQSLGTCSEQHGATMLKTCVLLSVSDRGAEWQDARETEQGCSARSGPKDNTCDTGIDTCNEL